jgi:hypothetical protein
VKFQASFLLSSPTTRLRARGEFIYIQYTYHWTKWNAWERASGSRGNKSHHMRLCLKSKSGQDVNLQLNGVINISWFGLRQALKKKGGCTFSKARNAPSKKSMTHSSSMKNTPNRDEASPTPISGRVHRTYYCSLVGRRAILMEGEEGYTQTSHV